jgi:hypothetical protein
LGLANQRQLRRLLIDCPPEALSGALVPGGPSAPGQGTASGRGLALQLLLWAANHGDRQSRGSAPAAQGSKCQCTVNLPLALVAAHPVSIICEECLILISSFLPHLPSNLPTDSIGLPPLSSPSRLCALRTISV